MNDKFNNLKKEVFEFVKLLVFWFLIFLVVTKFLVSPIQVVGSSMYPTLKNKERGFTSVISKNFEIERFDIVVVNAKGNNDDHWVKRVIGMPNETIECRNDVIYINGKELAQSFLDKNWMEEEKKVYGHFTENFGPYTLKENEYFLMGDNRTHSTDSRDVGAFTKDEISSVGIFVYYPFEELGVKE